MTRERSIVSLFIIVMCFLFREALEQHPLTHVLVQLPLLAIAGYIVFEVTPKWIRAFDDTGLVGLTIAITFIVFWMLPRSIDSALSSAHIETLKFISLPLLVGAPLKFIWANLHPNFRGFIKAQAISMLGVLAFLYTHSPVRICNAYLENAQIQLGYGFLWAAIGLTIYWVGQLFFFEQQNLANQNFSKVGV